MRYSAEILAEPAVTQEHLIAATISIVRLADSMGFRGDPDVSFKTIQNNVLTLNRNGQIDRTVIDAMPYEDKLRLIVTARDLGVGDAERARLNFVFGTSRLGRVIMSTQRLQTSDDFGALTLHEAGHAEGLVQTSQSNYDRLSSFGGHCVNQCLMLPGNSYTDMQSMVRRYHSHNPFCDDCSDFLGGRPRLPY